MTLDKNFFLKILQDVSKKCEKNDYKDVYFKEVEKFNNILELIDLDIYSLEYVQNRLIFIKRRDVEYENIETLVYSDLVSKYGGETRALLYDYYTKPTRKSYLTKPINKKDREKFTEIINEKECVKGYIYTSILNTIVLYALNKELFNETTAIVFTLNNSWEYENALEFLQSKLSPDFNSLENIIDLKCTADEKGQPKKNYYFKTHYKYLTQYKGYTKELDKLLNYSEDNIKTGENFDIKVSSFKDFNSKQYPVSGKAINAKYLETLEFFHMITYVEHRLFIFTDKKPNNKFSTSYLDDELLVDFDAIKHYLNTLLILTDSYNKED